MDRYPVTSVIAIGTLLVSGLVSAWLDSRRVEGTRRYRWWPWLDVLHYDPRDAVNYDTTGQRVLPFAKRVIWVGLVATALAWLAERYVRGS
jgi:hypothetical protein